MRGKAVRVGIQDRQVSWFDVGDVTSYWTPTTRGGALRREYVARLSAFWIPRFQICVSHFFKSSDCSAKDYNLPSRSTYDR